MYWKWGEGGFVYLLGRKLMEMVMLVFFFSWYGFVGYGLMLMLFILFMIDFESRKDIVDINLFFLFIKIF